MRSAVNLILLLFVTFLVTPTIVSVIDKSCDTSYFYNLSEEELSHKAVKEQKAPFKFHNSFQLAQLSSSLINSKNQLQHDVISPSIFSPPPKK